ncbi:MAG: hypothetical protein HY769_07300 [Candidatus Stahlbacteria bacterium]|nr:hypothetical protein [Candidatus Stahlbacteria bacterium]
MPNSKIQMSNKIQSPNAKKKYDIGLIENIFIQEKDKIKKGFAEKRKLIIENLASRGMLQSSLALSEPKKLDIQMIEQIYKKRLEIEFQVIRGKIDEVVADQIYKRVTNIIKGECSKVNRELLTTAEKIGVSTAIAVQRVIDKVKINFLDDAKRTIEIEKGKRKLESNISVEDKLQTKYISFLKGSFGYTKYRVSQKLKKVTNKKVRNILKRDIEIAIVCLIHKLWKPCVILCGGIIEGLLIEKLQERQKSKREQAYKQRYPDKKNKTCLEEYTLNELIGVCEKLEILEEPTAKMVQGVRDYRNYIHPKVESEQQHEILGNDANIGCQVIFKLLNELY